MVGVALARDYVDRQKFESIVPNTVTDDRLCDIAKNTEWAVCAVFGESSSECMVAHAAAVVACLFENDLTKAHQYFQYTEDDSLTCEAAQVAELTTCAVFESSSIECKAAYATCPVVCQGNCPLP